MSTITRPAHQNKTWRPPAQFAPRKDYCSYEEARRFVQRHRFDNRAAFRQWCDTHPKELARLRMPARPQRVYKNWVDWQAFLGTANAAGRKRTTYAPFRDARRQAREWARAKALTSARKWSDWAKKNKVLLRRHRIPACPNMVLQYRQAGQFRSWADWLGTNTAGTKVHLHD